MAGIALGSNQPSSAGSPRETILAAIDQLRDIAGTSVLKVSTLYETTPVSDILQPNFINAAATVMTTLTPGELLKELLEIERRLGRTRSGERNGPRTLDLDLLFYGDLVLESREVTLPHPRMHERWFVLAPLAEIAGDVKIAGPHTKGRMVREMLAELSGE